MAKVEVNGKMMQRTKRVRDAIMKKSSGEAIDLYSYSEKLNVPWTTVYNVVKTLVYEGKLERKTGAGPRIGKRGRARSAYVRVTAKDAANVIEAPVEEIEPTVIPSESGEVPILDED